jgi:hypothetical protein
LIYTNKSMDDPDSTVMKIRDVVPIMFAKTVYSVVFD